MLLGCQALSALSGFCVKSKVLPRMILRLPCCCLVPMQWMKFSSSDHLIRFILLKLDIH